MAEVRLRTFSKRPSRARRARRKILPVESVGRPGLAEDPASLRVGLGVQFRCKRDKQ